MSLSRVGRALAAGVWMVMRAPVLLAGVSVLLLVAAAPFGLMVAADVQSSLANQPPIDRGSVEIDPEWWAEFRDHASGLDATFAPTIIGFAAPLDNLSGILDGTLPSPALLGPIALAGLVWAFLWGGVMVRFGKGRRQGPMAFWSQGLRHLPGVAAIGVVAALATLVLYLTVHALLFGPVYAWLSAHAGSERSAFAWRVALYLFFGALLMAVTLVADYARVYLTTSSAPTVRAALASAVAFVRGHAGACVTLYVSTGALFVALLAAYGLLEIYGGSRVGGWRGIAIGQAFIMGRLAIRLTFAASEVRLFQLLTGRAP